MGGPSGERHPIPAGAGVVAGFAVVYDPNWPLHRRLWARTGRRLRGKAGWYPDQLHWWVRLGGWSLAAAMLAVPSVPFRLVSRWTIAAGPIAFEAGWLAYEIHRRNLLEEEQQKRRGPGPWPEEGGVREPRHPLPFAGAGAVALPEPGPDPGADS
jgi:hypothetical protein